MTKVKAAASVFAFDQRAFEAIAKAVGQSARAN